MRRAWNLKSSSKEEGYEVIMEPEFMTSMHARKLQGRHDLLDASSAALILQSYLDKLDKQPNNMISFEDFAKVEIKAGKILSAEKIPDTDKLLKLSVDFAEQEEITNEDGTKTFQPKPRQIVSGISFYFPDPQVLVGKTAMFVTNLEPRVIKGHTEQWNAFCSLYRRRRILTPRAKFSQFRPAPKPNKK
jgi:tRNA-binding EMAP/Myf-like protein